MRCRAVGGTLARLGDATLAALDAAPAGDLVARQPGRHHRRCTDRALRRRAASAAARRRGRRGAVHARAHRDRAERSTSRSACLPLMREAAKPVLTCWLGAARRAAAVQACASAGIPIYATPERAVEAFVRRRAVPAQPGGADGDAAGGGADRPRPTMPRARQVIGEALAQRRDAARRGARPRRCSRRTAIPVVPTRTVRDADEAAAAAAQIGFPVVLKILSPQISHKSDVGGVALRPGQRSRAARRRGGHAAARARRAAARCAARRASPCRRWCSRPRAHELIVGVATDPVFGPVILFGQGGTAVEVMRDSAIALPPLNSALARDLISRTRVAAAAGGLSRPRRRSTSRRSSPCLLQVSQMVVRPARAGRARHQPAAGRRARRDRARCARQGARRRRCGKASDRLAIRPYPAQLEETVRLRDGRAVLLRPIRPEDEPAAARVLRRTRAGRHAAALLPARGARCRTASWRATARSTTTAR